MTSTEELRLRCGTMDAPELLRYLLTEKYPHKTLVSCSLRGRSVVLLQMISEIDPATPIVFCHAPDAYPDSLEYRAALVKRLGLTDVREPGGRDERVARPGDCNHSESLWAEDPVDHSRRYSVVHLNRTLVDFDCWISGVYHGPYTDGRTAGPEITQEGRLVRVSPLAGWSQDRVRRFMADHGLAYHPRSALRHRVPTPEPDGVVSTYHF